MRPAAALLRRLEAEGAAKGWLRAGSYVYVHHKLLPLLAGLVEAVGAYIDAEAEGTFFDMEAAYKALEAAAKEGA